MNKETLQLANRIEKEIERLTIQKNKYKDLIEYLKPINNSTLTSELSINLEYRTSKKVNLVYYIDTENHEKRNSQFSIKRKKDFENFLELQIIEIDKEIMNLSDQFNAL
jgi:hypothetical protein